jgi:hypothetical protein
MTIRESQRPSPASSAENRQFLVSTFIMMDGIMGNLAALGMYASSINC